MILIARLIEGVHRPWRTVKALALLVVVLILSRGTKIQTNENVNGVSEYKQAAHWLDVFQSRLEATPSGPAVFIAASGGGSRAAIHTALVLEGIRETHPTFSRNVAVISAVSGRSLATAYYLNEERSVDAPKRLTSSSLSMVEAVTNVHPLESSMI